MANAIEGREESRKETGTSLMFIGLAIWVADALVVFFFPSAIRIGRQGMFLAAILLLAVVGVTLMSGGHLMRGKPEE
jgi:hypothetical protein